jgi:hypothetical protein
MQDKPDIAALIGSRICHDLISPIGAIGNGVELLMMDGAAKPGTGADRRKRGQRQCAHPVLSRGLRRSRQRPAHRPGEVAASWPT